MAIHAANRIADRRVPSLDALTFGGYFAYLGILSLITHFTRQTWFGFFFAPLPMLFLRMDNFRFMLLAFAGYLLYFPGNLPGSNFLFFNTPDSLVLAYIGLFLFNRRGYAEFLIAGGRVITWNEVFFADGVLLVPILLGLDLSKRIRGFLFASLVLCLMGLLACETRGLWISAAASFLVYASLRIRKAGFIGFDGLRKLLPALVLLVVSAEAILRLSSGTGLGGFILNRLTAHSANELVNPWSSLGYRIHESLVVWQKRTWFGHGSGARLYLFFTQLGMSKFINWWSIHSEYFETLHKYGFIGLGLLVWFLAATLRRALRLALRSARYPSTIGFAVLITLLNHCLVSITSGYLIRENVMLYMVVLVCMVERYLPRIEPIASKTSR
ncbi:MAG: O-antigen ligase family protein, partial [Fibrobacteres bacterium]|nr:O-antigen ligase family protein [Fibrobacterota bacterium]